MSDHYLLCQCDACLNGDALPPAPKLTRAERARIYRDRAEWHRSEANRLQALARWNEQPVIPAEMRPPTKRRLEAMTEAELDALERRTKGAA